MNNCRLRAWGVAILAIVLGLLAPTARALTITSAATGNWNAVATWAIVTAGIPGTITTLTTSPNVTGVGTQFTELKAGDQLYTNASVLIGTISSVASATSLTLTGNAAQAVTGATYRIRKVPDANDTVNVGTTAAHTVTVPNGVTSSAAALTIGASGTNGVAAVTLANTSTLNVTGAVTINRPSNNNNTNALNVGANTVTMGSLDIAGGPGNRVAQIAISTGTATVAGDVTFSGTAGNARITFSNTGTLLVGGALGTGGTLTASTGTVEYNGTAAQTVQSAYDYNNLRLNNAAGTSLTADATIGGSLRVMAGTFDLSTFTADGVGTLTLDAGTTLKIGGTNGLPAYGAYALNATSTVEYYGGNQSIGAAGYGHLTLSTGGTKTGPGGAMSIAGNFTHPSTVTFTSGAGTVTFNGTTPQQIAGNATNTTFTNVTINNTAATATDRTLTLAHNLTVSGTLTFTSGLIVTGSNKVALTSTGIVATPSSSSYVNGSIEKTYANGANLSFVAVDDFPVGDASNYTPVAITAGTAGAAGTLTVSTATPDHPQLGVSSNIDDDNSVNRYWRLVSTMNVNAMAATFSFVSADVDTGAPTASFVVQRYDQSTWNNTNLVAANATNTQISNLSFAAGTHDFAIGVALVPGSAGQAGRFNVFQSTTAGGSITGFIFTKQASVSVSDLDVVHVKQDRSGVQPGNVTVQIEIVDASAGGAVDLDSACNASWPVIQTLPGTLTFNGRVAIPAFTTLDNVYRDVRFKVTKTSGGSSQVGCSTDRFAIRPQSITLTAFDATWRTAGTTRPLTNTSATGGNVHAASTSSATTPRPFTLVATPVPASATNYDGNPTFKTATCGALCTTPGTVTFGSATWSPAGSGVRQNDSANYSEVGALQLELEDASFASVDAGDGTSDAERIIPTTAALTVGRFVPDRLEIASPVTPQFRTFGTSCTTSTPFTYVGQPFWYTTGAVPSLTINAVNAAGTVTSNYRSSLSLFKATLSETYSDNGVGPGFTASAGSFNQGNGTASYAAPAIGTGTARFTRSTTTPAAPFTANISLTIAATDNTEVGPGGNPANGDLVVTQVFNGSGSGIDFTNTPAFRYGFLSVADISAPLAGNSTGHAPLTLQARYWTGAAFATNTLDNCTPIVADNFVLYSHRGSINGTNMPTPTTGAANHVDMPLASAASNTWLRLASGVALVKIKAPNPAVTSPGSVRICLDLDSAGGDTTCQAPTPADKTYLQGRWTASNYDKDPSARASFGVFGAQPRNFIFFRENY